MRTAAMNRLIPSILFLLCLSLLAEDFPRAQWIHYPEPDAEGLHKDRYFWTDVDVSPTRTPSRLPSTWMTAGTS